MTPAGSADFASGPPLRPVCCCHLPLQLMTPAAVLARTNGREAVSRGDVEEVHTLFRCGQAWMQLYWEGFHAGVVC